MRNPFKLTYKFFRYYNISKKNNWNYQILFACDIFIPNLPASTRILHPVGIVISNLAQIGKNCTIMQNVTIGQRNKKVPKIGNNVYIGAGAIVIGDIVIGDNTVIGAGAIITKDVPENSIVYNKVELVIKTT